MDDARPDRPLRGEPLLAAGDRTLLKAERLVGRGLPRAYNPLAWTGALAGFNFILAAITGIILLFAYDTSVHSAHASIAAMQQQPWGMGLVRTMHRYSSDACVLFAVIHGIKVFLARKFTGARWIAWITGLLLLGMVWLDGWLGYWLTWDQRAQAIAVGSAQVLDVLPIFPEPLTRSFLTNDGINSLIFFAVFFAHVLLPIPIGIMIWIHLVRLKKPAFLPGRNMMIAVALVLIVASLVVPATLAQPADMRVFPDHFDMDWFYLLPLFFTDRMAGGWFWLFAIGLLAGLSSLPWLLARPRKQPAKADQKTCNGCTQCFQDCPYEAISMVKVEGKENLVSLVDPKRCVSCGVCVGSCDPGAMRYEDLDRRTVRDRVLGWMQQGGPKAVAFLCADGAGRHVRFDLSTGLTEELPGFRVVGIPCAAWLHSSLVELIVRKGGRVLLVACDGSEPRCRLGSEIAALRVAGKRDPVFDEKRIPAGAFQFVQLESTRPEDLRTAAARFLDVLAQPEVPVRTAPPLRVLIGAATVLLLLAALLGISRLAYIAPSRPPSMLVVAFKHAGQ
ncbi:MAG: cytochrome b N-terminal domain-containing protein, partial [Planctomycetes bacterium]|nr:cytochrome b N-terminal domain-containing protein [Planctomycetota bacterium]